MIMHKYLVLILICFGVNVFGQVTDSLYTPYGTFVVESFDSLYPSENYSYDGSATAAGGTAELVEITVNRSVVMLDETTTPDPEILLFPSPATTYFQILTIGDSSSVSSLQVWNVAGEMIYFKEYNEQAMSTLNINVEEWPAGAYVLQVTVQGISLQRKLIIAGQL